jgi:hypothetical protein
MIFVSYALCRRHNSKVGGHCRELWRQHERGFASRGVLVQVFVDDGAPHIQALLHIQLPACSHLVCVYGIHCTAAFARVLVPCLICCFERFPLGEGHSKTYHVKKKNRGACYKPREMKSHVLDIADCLHTLCLRVCCTNDCLYLGSRIKARPWS